MTVKSRLHGDYSCSLESALRSCLKTSGFNEPSFLLPAIRRIPEKLRSVSCHLIFGKLSSVICFLQFRSQGDYGVELRCFGGGVYAEEQSHSCGDEETDENGPELDLRRERDDEREDFGE